MMSNIRYRSFKRLDLRKKKPFNILVFAILFIYIIATIPELMIFVITVLYALSGPVERLLFRKKARPEDMVDMRDKKIGGNL
jgi:CDP-diacylglycerol--serine O-phosphatidyltransferase